MATTSEVGISPVLLQAITHTLSGSASRAVKQEVDLKQNGENRHSQVVIQTPSEENHSVIKMEGTGHGSLLHGMSQPVSSQTENLQEPGETVIVVQTSLDESGDQVENVDPTHSGRLQRSHIIIKGVSGVEGEADNPTGDVTTNHNNVNMGSVLTAIASHLKNRSVNIPSKQHVQETDTPSVEVQHIQESAEIQQPIYVTYANNINVPSPSNDITVSTGGEIENVVTETVVQTSPTDLSSGPGVKRYKLDIPSDSEGRTMIIVNPENLVIEGSSAGVETYQVSGAPFAWKGVTVGSGGNNTITSSGGSNTELPWQPCPICGDRISGYHYGIYSCESCKGFFKRTVQNKKAFICHRKGECVVNIGNRKKCPACRFKRCLVTGMKLEAIREDRTRGGRSSYDGCSPHGRLTKPPPSPRTPTTPRIVPVNNNNTEGMPVQTVKPQVVVPVTTATQQGAQIITMVRPMEEHVINGKEEYVLQIQPNVPQLLEDLMAVESLMSEDDGEQSCCEGRLQDGDTNLFGSVLHFADHCLYKIVRWARNLPDFARVCTDDQILLLQNCWAELLCLSCSYHSRTYQQKDQLRLAYGRLLDLDTSRRMGLGEVAERLMGFAEHMCRLEVDAHEFVALKVLMLLTPDVKNLKDEDIVRSYQDQLCEALMVYTSSHYQHRPEKVCQMLAVLPEISRTCLISKDLLLQRQNAGDIPQYSLLSELLKGDITVQ